MRRRTRSSTRILPDGTPLQNHLLAGMPIAEYNRIARHLRMQSTVVGDTLHEHGSRIDQVYFPNGGVVSITNHMRDGGLVEVATVGREGMLGVGVFLCINGGILRAGHHLGGIEWDLSALLRSRPLQAALTLVLNAELVPRANERLATVLASGAAPEREDRMMTIGELHAAARSARADTGLEARARTAYFEVEIQKKYALAAACVVLACAGVAIALLFPHGRAGLVIGASIGVFGAYYVGLVAGESLADRMVVSPFAAMWMANAVFLAAALLVMWRSRAPRAPRGPESFAIGA